MRIRTKLTLMVVQLLAGLLVSLGIFILFFSIIDKQREFQEQAAGVYSSLEVMESETRNLLMKQQVLGVLQTEWVFSINQFSAGFEALALTGESGGLTNNQIQKLKELWGFWNQIHQWYYVPAIDHLTSILGSTGEVRMDNDSYLLMLQRFQSSNQPGVRKALGDLITLRNYVGRINDETKVFITDFTDLSNSIQKQLDGNIQNAWGLGTALALFSLVLSLYITYRFSHGLVNHIRQFEVAMRSIANGDFSSELDIRSGDEFEELSMSYTALKIQLQEKMNSVLNFMLTVATSLEKGPDLDETLSIITNSAVENTEATGAAIYLLDSEEQQLVPHAFSGFYIPPFPLPPEAGESLEELELFVRDYPIPMGENIVGKAVQEARTIFLRSPLKEEDGTMDYGASREGPFQTGSTIVAPLMISHRVLGAIVISKKPREGAFTDLDFTHMQTFADYAALTIDNHYNTSELIEKREMHREISIAADIQKGLLPRAMPGLASAQIAAFSRAARGISGDYYDGFEMDKGKVGVVICDVVGKGVPASLLMVMIRTIIRLVANAQRTPGKLLTFLNRGIIGRVGTEHFATLSILSYDEPTRTVTYANAAHPPLLIYRPGEKSFIEVDTPGLPIGVERSEVYQEKSFTAEKGDVMVLYTDGIPEARSSDGREYGSSGLRSRIKQAADKSARDIAQSVQSDLDNFAAGMEQHDDQTMVVMKIT